jgi:hypothetical protein
MWGGGGKRLGRREHEVASVVGPVFIIAYGDHYGFRQWEDGHEAKYAGRIAHEAEIVLVQKDGLELWTGVCGLCESQHLTQSQWLVAGAKGFEIRVNTQRHGPDFETRFRTEVHGPEDVLHFESTPRPILVPDVEPKRDRPRGGKTRQTYGWSGWDLQYFFDVR